MAGVPPLGYDPHPDRQRRELVVNAAEAETVGMLFELYVELGRLNAVVPPPYPTQGVPHLLVGHQRGAAARWPG